VTESVKHAGLSAMILSSRTFWLDFVCVLESAGLKIAEEAT
jgi:hypothetical protein